MPDSFLCFLKYNIKKMPTATKTSAGPLVVKTNTVMVIAIHRLTKVFIFFSSCTRMRSSEEIAAMVN